MRPSNRVYRDGRWGILCRVLDFLKGADLCPFGDVLTDHNILCPPVILRLPGPAGRFHTPDLFAPSL